MKTPTIQHEFQCNKCGAFFDELATIHYREYAGASTQEEYVSPCCFEHYSEVDEVVL